jgi:NAD(P)-dependent dehydrogenase (short-subunit alcohol dehydrogenase family)
MQRSVYRFIAALAILLVLPGLPGLPGSTQVLAGEIDPGQPTVLITGSNRGIGLAFAEHYAAAGWNVIATARRPDTATDLIALAGRHPRVLIEALDVTDGEAIHALAERYRGTPVDLLINNAGVYGDIETQDLGRLDSANFAQVMAVNVLAPLLLTEAFTEHVAASGHKKIIALTSGAGSTSRVRNGTGIYYSTSKAALNMAMRKAALALAERGIIVAAIAPGAVDTDMLAQARPGLRGIEPATSVAGMAEVIAGLDSDYDGRPRNFDGSVLDW